MMKPAWMRTASGAADLQCNSFAAEPLSSKAEMLPVCFRESRGASYEYATADGDSASSSCWPNAKG